MTHHETPDKRRINDDPVALPPALVPARSVLTGSMVRLEPIDPARHTAALYRSGHATEAARSSWAFLPWGPFPSEAAMHAQLRDFAASLDRVFYAICDRATGEARRSALANQSYPMSPTQARPILSVTMSLQGPGVSGDRSANGSNFPFSIRSTRR